MIIILNEEEMKEYYTNVSITEFASDSDCYIITKADKNTDCIIYDENIPITFSGEV